MPASIAPAAASIRPLTFLQTLQSADVVIGALLEQESVSPHRKQPSSLRKLGRRVTRPLYYHLVTSGYGAFDADRLIGWMYLRGWYQVLYIDTLIVHHKYQGQGVGCSLLDFAEKQAREQHREWLGLTVTTGNMASLGSYEAHGFERGHWRIMRCAGGVSNGTALQTAVRLQPLLGSAAQRAFWRFATLDMNAGDTAGHPTLTRFLMQDPYHGPGLHWLVVADGVPIAYLNRSGTATQPTVFVASGPERWDSPALVDALRIAAGAGRIQPDSVDVRLGSSRHHESARALLEPLGFSEQPAAMLRMFKCLTGTGQAPAEEKRQP